VGVHMHMDPPTFFTQKCIFQSTLYISLSIFESFDVELHQPNNQIVV
jgi:hypothetical protein